MISLYISALVMAFTAMVHSYFGEKRLIIPILASDLPVATNPLGRTVIRFAWHFTTVLMLLSAAAVAWPETPAALIAIIGVTWLATGLFDAVITKGKHIGWPPITIAGLFALIGVFG